MARGRAKGPSQRQLRVGEELRHALSRIMARGGLRDPELAEANITVTEVRMSPDLKNATAFVVPFAGGEMTAVVAALRRAAPYLRTQIGQEVDLRFTPNIRFEADTSFDEAARIEALLRQPRVQRDLDHADAPADDAGDAGDPDASDQEGGHGR